MARTLWNSQFGQQQAVTQEKQGDRYNLRGRVEIHVRDLEIPPNTKILNNPDAVVVRIEKPGSDEILAAGEEGTAQPEVIGRKAAEDEEAE